MHFGFCQIALTALYAMSLGIHLAKNGQPRTDNYSIGTALISCVIQLVLLYFGGFYG